MTDHHDPLDELASAHLDGATSPEEAARVAADPALQARVEQLRSVREALRMEPVVDPARRAVAIDAALAAFADEATPVGAGRGSGAVTSLAAVAERRRQRSGRAIRILGAAAVAALLALLVPVLGSLDSSSDDESAGDAFEATGDKIEEDGAETGGGTAEDTSGDGAAAPTTSTAGLPPDLGAFDDVTALLDSTARTSSFDAGLESAPTAGEALTTACPDTDGTNRSVRTGVATVAGDRVIVVLVTTADGTRSVEVRSIDGCSLLGSRPLDP